MEKTTNRDFITKTESLVQPKDVTTISFLGEFNKILSKKRQKVIMEKGSIKVPYMGFIVDPWCTFLAYKIKDTQAAQAMLPKDFELMDTAVFKGQEDCPMVILSSFSARTSAFIGNRLEIYIIARHKKTGRTAWIIADYETNTNSYDPKQCFCGYSTESAIFTTTPYGEVLVDFRGKNGKQFTFTADIEKGIKKDLNSNLWVEGNMTVDYGGKRKTEGTVPFSLIFDPVLMDSALHIPNEYVHVEENTYQNDLIDKEGLICAAVFPYSQHFIIKQDLEENTVTNNNDLHTQVDEFLKRKDIKRMEGDDIKKPLLRGMLVSAIISYGIIITLAILFFLK